MKTAILSSLLMLSVFFNLSATGKASNPPDSKTGKTFVLVHGAWLAPYCWDEVAKT